MTKPICNRPCHGAPPLLWVRVIARGASPRQPGAQPRQPGAQPPGNLGAQPQDHLPLHMFMCSSSLIKRSPPRAFGAAEPCVASAKKGRTQSPEPRAQSPELESQSLAVNLRLAAFGHCLGLQNPCVDTATKGRIQSPEPRAQSSEPRAQSPESGRLAVNLSSAGFWSALGLQTLSVVTTTKGRIQSRAEPRA